MFDSISVTRAQTETKIASLQNELQCNIYKNAKLRTQLFKKVSDQKDNTQDSSKNTKFAKQPNVEILSKIGKTDALSKPVTSNSVSTPQVSKGVNNAKVIALCMFRISQDKVSREAKKVPNTVSASSRTKPITVSQPSVITKKNMNSDLNGLSSTGLDNTKTRRPQPRSNSKNARDVISKVVCVMCKKCLISINHDECLVNYVNGKNSRGKKQKAKVSFKEIQMKNQPKIKKPKKVGTHKSLATPKPRKHRFLLRRSPTGKMFDQDGKLVAPSNSESHIDCSNGDNACTSNAMEPKIKWFPNSTSLLGRKFLGTVRFGNDHVAAILGFSDLHTVKFGNDHVAKIMGYGDYKIWNVTISRVYFVEGLGYNLFLVGQFCDSDLEVAFRQHTCFIRNLDGVDLLTGSRGNNLYTLSLQVMMASSPICLLSKASKTKSWLWHHRLSHLNFGAINHLARQGHV
nr:hypothetical protein [Tanacetum cinerariifolium]